VLITGAGPIGLLVALIGKQRGLDVPSSIGPILTQAGARPFLGAATTPTALPTSIRARRHRRMHRRRPG
jgi:hypothetical protein